MPAKRRKSAVGTKTPSRRSGRLSLLDVGEAEEAVSGQTDVHNVQHVPSLQVSSQNQSGKTSTTTKTVTTETIIRQSSGRADSNITSTQSERLSPASPRPAYDPYELEPWEIAPKTGYTYAQSPSYSRRYLDVNEWVMPNMSRRRLRDGAPVTSPRSGVSLISPSSSVSSLGDLQSISQVNVHTHHSDHHHADHISESRHAALQESYMGHLASSRRRNRNFRSIDKDQSEDGSAMEQQSQASTTRSGRRDGTRRRSARHGSSKLETEVNEMSVDEYRQLEKQMEYSGEAGLYKESSRLSLYGLDHAEDHDILDEMDLETRTTSVQTSTSTNLTSLFWSLVTTIITITTTVIEMSMFVATAPVRWLTQSADSTSTTDDDQNLHTDYTSIATTSAALSEESSASLDKHSDMGQLTRSQTTTITTDITDSAINQGEPEVTDTYSDDEILEEATVLSSSKRSRNIMKGSIMYEEESDETSDEDDSLCMRLIYVMIAVAYMLFIALPTGVFKVARSCSVWLYTFLLLPVVDAASSGYSLVSGSVYSIRNLFTDTAMATTSDSTTTTSVASTSTTATHTTHSAVAKHVAGEYSASWLQATAGYYGNKLLSVVSTTAQTIVVLLWAPAAGLCYWLYHVVLCRWCWGVGVWIHSAAARILLLDVWILSSVWRRGAWCCLLLPLLLLLVPLLLGALYHVVPVVTDHTAVPVVARDKAAHMAAAGISASTIRQIIAEELIAVKADLKLHGDQLSGNMAYIQRLEKQLESQALLMGQLKDCCKNDTVLAGLVRSGVQQQLAAIMMGGGSDDSGTSSDGSAGAAAGGLGSSQSETSITNAAFVTWLNSQFSGPSDPNFDAKIAELTATLNKGLKEQAEANNAAMLAIALAEQAAKHANDESNRAAGLAVSVQEAQGAQAAAWTNDQADLRGIIAGLTADLKTTDEKANSAQAAALGAATAAEGATTLAGQASTTAQGASDSAGEATILAAAASDTSKEATFVAGTAAATANDASAAAKDASTAAAAAAVLVQQQGEKQAAAGIAAGAATQCGCEGQNLVLPDNYQALTEAQVKVLIREALSLFDADKTGMVDYALESAGGSVISTRCSETYYRRTAQLSLFGFPLWYPNNSPRTVIQPDMQPGQCWPFKGSEGYMVIQLAGWVKISSFSLEHIPKTLSPSGNIDSAPKDFTVWGLQYERDTNGALLGNYTYQDNNEPLQIFPVRDPDLAAFHIIELRINSNHGNPNYTCIYRFRVHGVLKKT